MLFLVATMSDFHVKIIRNILLYGAAFKKLIIYGSRYSRMDKVKFVKDSLSKNFTWSIIDYFVPYLQEVILCKLFLENFSRNTTQWI